MLQNAYLDAKIGVDPAENEPSKVSAPVLSVNIPRAQEAGRRARGEFRGGRGARDAARGR